MFDRTKYLNEGAEAGLDGEPRENCPYALNSLECELWMDGWRCADDDASVTLGRSVRTVDVITQAAA
jgi:ribosome modulation factor